MARASPKHSVHVSNRTLEWQRCAKRFAALNNTKALNPNCMPGLSGPSGPSGGHAARAKKAKGTEAEGSAAAAALKIVKAQARADAAAEKKVADAARKVATEAEGSAAEQRSSPLHLPAILPRMQGFDAHRSRSDQLKSYAGNLGGECGDGRYDEDITITRIGRRRRPRGCFSAGQCRLRE